MRILIVKTSSLGDVVHMLPALTDAARAIPGLTADWVVEEGFAAVPAWHPNVARVIPIALRRWRKRLGEAATWRELAAARRALGETAYDAVIDSQGLLKSALFAHWARGPRWGYDRASCREPLASLFYTHRVHVPRGLHAIERNRRLLAGALGYPLNDVALDYGLSTLAERLPPSPLGLPERYVVALHGTSRIDKEWPEAHWIAVGQTLAQHGLALLLPWGNPREHERALRIAPQVVGAIVLPRLGLNELAAILARAQGVLGVDTGLMHIAAALGRPGLALYPVTAPALTGVRSAPGHPPIASLTPADGLTPEQVSARLLAALHEAQA